MFGFTHFAGVEFAGFEVDTIEATDSDVGFVFNSRGVEFFGEIWGDIIVAINKADEFATGFLDAVFTATPDAFVLFINDDDFIFTVFFLITFKNFQTIIGRAIVDTNGFYAVHGLIHEGIKTFG